jgi:DNA-binding transcriptional ArsR family regulator
MSEPMGLPEIDRVVHEPARLAILTVLASCQEADFLFLERATGLTRGNLSVQLTRLEEAGLIRISKTIVKKRTLTTAQLTEGGGVALKTYWASMEAMRTMAEVRGKSKTRSRSAVRDKGWVQARSWLVQNARLEYYFGLSVVGNGTLTVDLGRE